MSVAPRHREGLAPLLLGAMAGALVAGRLETAVACLVVASWSAARAGAPRPSLGWIRVLMVGSVVSLALNLYLNGGPPLAGWPAFFGRPATALGLKLGVLLVLRVLGAAIAVHGLRAAWPGERAADEVASLLAPLERLRLPVRRARAVMGLALRFAPVVGEEFGRVARLQALRAGRAPRGVRERLQRQRAAAVPALVSALERAERVALALEARHYRLRPIAESPRRAWGPKGAGLALAGAALLWRG